jgi:hypothetical protein
MERISGEFLKNGKKTKDSLRILVFFSFFFDIMNGLLTGFALFSIGFGIRMASEGKELRFVSTNLSIIFFNIMERFTNRSYSFSL